MRFLFLLDGVKYEEAEIGVGLERVLRYFTIRGKLTHVISGSGVGFSTGVDSGLRAFGVKKIEIDFQSGVLCKKSIRELIRVTLTKLCKETKC